jgi:hypothetical protein
MHDSSATAADTGRMRCPRETAIQELESLLASATELRSAVRSTERRYRKARRLLKEGTPVSEALDEVGAGAARQVMTETLATFEQMRHRTRLALIAAGLAEGMTIGELGRSWGFSRQLASRYAKEARGRLRQATSTSKGSAA